MVANKGNHERADEGRGDWNEQNTECLTVSKGREGKEWKGCQTQ
jgi:hypothetical protein